MTGIVGTDFDAPVAGAAGKRARVRPHRWDSDDEEEQPTKRRTTGKVTAQRKLPGLAKALHCLWAEPESELFHAAYLEHDQDWAQVAYAVGTKSAADCEALFYACSDYLKIDKSIQSATVFAQMVLTKQRNEVQPLKAGAVTLNGRATKCKKHGNNKGRKIPRSKGSSIPKAAEPRTPAKVVVPPDGDEADYYREQGLDLLCTLFEEKPDLHPPAPEAELRAPQPGLPAGLADLRAAQPGMPASQPEQPVTAFGIRSKRKPSTRQAQLALTPDSNEGSGSGYATRSQTPQMPTEEDDMAADFLLFFASASAKKTEDAPVFDDEFSLSPEGPLEEDADEEVLAASALRQEVGLPVRATRLRTRRTTSQSEVAEGTPGPSPAPPAGQAAEDTWEKAPEPVPTPEGRVTRSSRVVSKRSSPSPQPATTRRPAAKRAERPPPSEPIPEEPLKKRLRAAGAPRPARFEGDPSTTVVKPAGFYAEADGSSSHEDGSTDDRHGGDDAGAAGRGLDGHDTDDDVHYSVERGSETPDLPVQGRQHRRKPLPERLPNMTSHNIKSIFLRRPQLPVDPPPTTGRDTDTSMRVPEKRLRRILAPRARRWIMYEFLYSAVDRPWYMENGLPTWLRHLGISPATKLYRKEWNAVKGGIGKPRRMSLSFLREERAKLERYRMRVRAKYKDSASVEDVPHDVPRQLGVSQRVTARHPQTRQLHDGKILTISDDCYRVQFDRRELAVEMVRDVDVMPIDPTECLPPKILEDRPPTLFNGRVAPGLRPRPNQPLANDLSSPARAPTANRAQQEARSAVAAAAARDSAHQVDAANEVDDLTRRKAELETRIERMKMERQQGKHSNELGRPDDDWQRRFSELVLHHKKVSTALNEKINITTSPSMNSHAVSAMHLYLQTTQTRPPRPAAVAHAEAVPLPPAVAPLPVVAPTWAEVQAEATRVVKAARTLHNSSRKPGMEVEVVKSLNAEQASGQIGTQISKEANSLHQLLLGAASLNVSLTKAQSEPGGRTVENLSRSADAMKPKCARNMDVYQEMRGILEKITEFIAQPAT